MHSEKVYVTSSKLDIPPLVVIYNNPIVNSTIMCGNDTSSMCIKSHSIPFCFDTLLDDFL